MVTVLRLVGTVDLLAALIEMDVEEGSNALSGVRSWVVESEADTVLRRCGLECVGAESAVTLSIGAGTGDGAVRHAGSGFRTTVGDICGTLGDVVATGIDFGSG